MAHTNAGSNGGRKMRRAALLTALLTLALALLPDAAAAACAPDNGGITLPDGFCASVFADSIGQARHLAVGDDGTVFVNTWRSPYRRDLKVPPGGFLVALRDANGDGVAEIIERFGEDSANAVSTGGTGAAIHRGYLYAEETGRIVRYPLAPGRVAPRGESEVIVSALRTEQGHVMHPFVITREGLVFVNSGSPSNACQVKDRARQSPGKDPCEELMVGAGIWQYDATSIGQIFGADGRYATGLRNNVALAVHPTSALYVVQHGRDQLYENWPKRFSQSQGAELPAEPLFRITQNADYGWPYCYYDGKQDRHVLAPEYGGDGRRTERCTDKPAPLAAFPAHWAPNALLFYTGSAFPERYRGGAFIAFHGSWNRPVQQGYNVVFQPLDAAGNPRGNYEVFADGFAGGKPLKDPTKAAHRPSGLAMGPDGALYISDDQHGRIWKVTRR
jgi:glucose/arabinose dehydrogenase